jgi:hypothetical protein
MSEEFKYDCWGNIACSEATKHMSFRFVFRLAQPRWHDVGKKVMPLVTQSIARLLLKTTMCSNIGRSSNSTHKLSNSKVRRLARGSSNLAQVVSPSDGEDYIFSQNFSSASKRLLKHSLLDLFLQYSRLSC